MKTILRWGAAALLATGLSISAASAGGHHGGGFAGGGGGHAVIGGGGGRAPHVTVAKPGVAFNGGGVRSVPHFNGRHISNGNHEGNFGHNRHHHHNRFFAYSVPLYDYDYSYGYSNGCGWLWQRYLNTGNPRWKHRYYECIE